MKIKKIKFKNINSLKNENEVDFTSEPLSSAAIFAITGATGSGKSTILDAVSLALFNSVPRIEPQKITKKVIQDTNAILTKNTNEAYSEVEYECSKGTFISRWSISTTRTGNLRDYDMALFDEFNNQLTDKKSDVPPANEKNTGLNYEQFVRSIMLAQGEFAKFLRSNKDERSKLLEKITNGGIYREIGKKVFYKWREFDDKSKQLKDLIENMSEQLLSKDEIEELKNKLNKAKDEEKLSQKLLTDLEKEIDKAGELREYEVSKKKNERKLKEENKELDDFLREYSQKLKKHEALLPVESGLQKWNSKVDILKSLKTKKEKHEQQLTKAQKNKRLIHDKIENFLNKKIKQEEAEPELRKLEDHVLELQRKDDELAQKLDHQFEQTNDLAKNKFNRLQKIETGDIKDLEDKVSIDETELISLRKKANIQDDDETEVLTGNLRAQKELTLKWSYFEKDIGKLNTEISNNKTKSKEFEKIIESLPPEIEKKKEEQEKAAMQLQILEKEKENRQLKADLNDHRKNLKKGEPCPLCGSKEHPLVEHYEEPADDISNEIDDKKKQLDRLKEAYSELANNLKFKNEESDKLAKDITEKEKELETSLGRKEDLIKKIDKEFSALDPAKAGDLIENYIEMISEAQKLNDEIEKNKKLIPVLKSIRINTEKQENIKRSIAEVYQGNNIRKDVDSLLDNFKSNLKEIENIDSNIAEVETEIENAEKEIESITNEIMPKLKKAGYETAETALKSLMSSVNYNKLIETKKQTEGDISNLKYKLEDIEGKIEKLKEHVSGTTEELNTKKTKIIVSLEELKLKRDRYNAEYSNQMNLKDQLKKQSDALEKLKKDNRKWKILKEMIGDSEGKNFSRFAQNLTLRQLIKYANNWTGQLNDRYVIDIPNNEDGQDDLIVYDRDFAGRDRSVKTLSGGESFLVSLALALALSDMASKNVSINSLFIDEGFGSLDQDTLDQTLDTLEKLQAKTDKTIGIISHVEALKERIPTQITVKKDGKGFSKINITNNII